MRVRVGRRRGHTFRRAYETMAGKRRVQGRTPARREGGLVGAGREDSLLRLVKKMTVLAEAVTVGNTS